jgi:hypothetical protein
VRAGKPRKLKPPVWWSADWLDSWVLSLNSLPPRRGVAALRRVLEIYRQQITSDSLDSEVSCLLETLYLGLVGVFRNLDKAADSELSKIAKRLNAELKNSTGL